MRDNDGARRVREFAAKQQELALVKESDDIHVRGFGLMEVWIFREDGATICYIVCPYR